MLRRRQRRGADTAPLPVVTSAVSVGGVVTIVGSGFRSPGGQFQVDYVTFGTARASSLTVIDAETLTCSPPSGNTGAATIYVTSHGGTATFAYAGAVDHLLLETGDTLTSEAGDRLVLES